ncbi:hypothetical protein HPB47_000600 [Ixodes persulcatus]|uniref:Uncharacterized protein n=1 Tax=Ixodes persulcatus TaxID=34615 RepID=A0AC60PRL9_IXOPE|nr:hypothetical protein HPB47_000600 [Ixodes persulcatus]
MALAHTFAPGFKAAKRFMRKVSALSELAKATRTSLGLLLSMHLPTVLSLLRGVERRYGLRRSVALDFIIGATSFSTADKTNPFICRVAANVGAAALAFVHQRFGPLTAHEAAWRAYGKRKRRAWNKSSTESTVTLPAAVSQEVLLPAAASFSPAPGPDTGVDSAVGGSTLRVDTHFFSPDESAERAARVDKRKQELAAKSATERKFDLLNVTRENEEVDSGTQFIIVDLKVLNTFFASTKCGQCGSAAPALKKSKGQQYGLAVKLELTCPACDFRVEHFSSPRTEGEARITPFEVNMRAVKGIQSIGKGLGDKDLLERCSDGKTQNPSESLHAVIWAQTSKNTHASLFSVQRAVAEAVSVFDQGQKRTNESVVASLGYTAGSALIRRSIEKDDRRHHKANKVFLDSDSMKKQLSTRHRADTAQDYSPGLL